MLNTSEAPFLVGKLANELESRHRKIVTAESCTGGMLASVITRRAGASSYFERGFITYSNESKHETLGVQTSTIKKYGAVSKETALEMANGAIKNSQADISIAITGIAGPDGGTKDKPLGLVFIAVATQEKTTEIIDCQFEGDRTEIQLQATVAALKLAIKVLQQTRIT